MFAWMSPDDMFCQGLSHSLSTPGPVDSLTMAKGGEPAVIVLLA